MAGFVNAVLRKISKNKEAFLEEDDGEFFTQEFKSLLRKSYSAKVLAEIEKYAMWAGTASAAGAYERCLDIIRKAPAANGSTNTKPKEPKKVTPSFGREEVYD
jgi:hypothetical protein